MLELNSAVYGIPDAGQAFAMLMQGLHIKECGMTQCQVDPSIYSKYELDEDGKTKEYLFVITWTDDVRYFGTPKLLAEYERIVQEKIKCKLEGVSEEYVSISMKQDIVNGTTELTQPKKVLGRSCGSFQDISCGFRTKEESIANECGRFCFNDRGN